MKTKSTQEATLNQFADFQSVHIFIDMAFVRKVEKEKKKIRNNRKF